MTIEDEDLAIALWVQEHHGEQGPVFIAEQIGALVIKDDQAGVERWKRIAAVYQEVCSASLQ